MSKHWINFPCTIGQTRSWISFDYGIRDEIKALPFANCIMFKIDFSSPTNEGFLQNDEAPQVAKVEDDLIDRIDKQGGIFVGHITKNGERIFYFYSNANEQMAELIANKATSITTYQVYSDCIVDEERSTYLNELYPSQDDWQVIKDIRIEDALRKNGDPLNLPRKIIHWSYFPSAADRSKFVGEIGCRFSEVRLFDAPTSKFGEFGVEINHVGLPDHISMNEITLLLARKSRAFSGIYDGWEAELCKKTNFDAIVPKKD